MLRRMAGNGLPAGVHLILLITCCSFAGALTTEVKGHVGSSVLLPCKVDKSQCGELFRVKWYRGSSRIYGYSGNGNSRGEGDMMYRLTIKNSNGSEVGLSINPVKVDDEAIYKCEITYYEMKENCEVVQLVQLKTVVIPSNIKLIDKDKNTLGNHSMLGPYNEGTNVEVTCEAIGGRPIPKVSWYNGSVEMKSVTYSKNEDEGGAIVGVGTGRSKFNITLTRGDLNAKFECRVESDALEKPIVSRITADVNVHPRDMQLSEKSNNSFVSQGTNITLLCDVFGSKPAPEINWFNNSEIIADHEKIYTKHDIVGDGTTTTRSTLKFVATRWDNGRVFVCMGKNQVTKELGLNPLKKIHTLEVMYPPVVSVGPENINETVSSNVSLRCSYSAHPSDLLEVVWNFNGTNLTLSDTNKYEGGTPKNPSLKIKNISRFEMGFYKCILRNMMGSSESENEIFLNVEFPPEVEVIMDPSTPVRAIDKENVTLTCNVKHGNPPELQEVNWYFNDFPEKIPLCKNSTNGKHCSPNSVILIGVTEKFAGNYTCQGRNRAGPGLKSEKQELLVYYPPSPTKITFNTSTGYVVKKQAVTLHCAVTDRGRPENLTFEWYRGNRLVADITTDSWTISPVALETRSNFTCVAVNTGGKSTLMPNSTTKIDVKAPPAFVNVSSPYKGVPAEPNINVSLTCRVECSPLCSITWLKHGVLLNTSNNPLYYTVETDYPPDAMKNDFESKESTLVWNITNWPNKTLDKTSPVSNYTCKSTSNEFGSGVTAAFQVVVEYPPENVTVSDYILTVLEGNVPPSVKCGAKGNPVPQYYWQDRNQKNVSYTDVLKLGSVTREDSGLYTCFATNKPGTSGASFALSVEYKPECTISVEDSDDGKQMVVCNIIANPLEVDFHWRIIRGDENVTIDSGKGSLVVEPDIEIPQVFYCQANNSAGTSEFCYVEVAAGTSWWKKFNNENMIILIAVVIGIIVCVIIICIIIICICRRKRSQTKYNSHVELEEREKPEGFSPEIVSRYPKWPLKPGVLVHVSAMRNLGVQQVKSEPYKTTQVNRDRDRNRETTKQKRRCNKVYERLERLRDRIKYGDPETLPIGVYHSPNGVVTFKKLPTSSPIHQQTQTRKRKKPGEAPNTTTGTVDRRRNGDSSRNGSKDPLTPAEKEFYENLPFHGMQNPPNKPVSIIMPIMKDIQNRSNHKSHSQSSSSTKTSTPTIRCNNSNNNIISPSGNNNTTNKTRKTLRVSETFSQSSSFDNNQNLFKRRKESRQNLLNSSQTTLASFSFTPISARFQNSNSGLDENEKVMRRSQSFHRQINFSINSLESSRKSSPNSQQQLNRSDQLLHVVERNEEMFGKENKKEKGTATFPSSFASNCNLSLVEENKSEKKRLEMNYSFGSLDIRKHRCYSPTFYSLRCKKHYRRRSVMYALPKTYFTNSTLKLAKHTTGSKMTIKSFDFEQKQKENENGNGNGNSTVIPIPAPRCKKHQRRPSFHHIYQNLVTEPLKQSIVFEEKAIVHKQENDQEDNNESVIETVPLLILRNNPDQNTTTNNTTTTTSVSNSSDKIPTDSEIVFELKESPKPNFYTLATPHSKNTLASEPPENYSATIPHQNYKRSFFPQQPLIKSSSFSLKTKQKKHFQVPLQKCHSFKSQSNENYFQPIKNKQEERYMQPSHHHPPPHHNSHQQQHHHHHQYPSKSSSSGTCSDSESQKRSRNYRKNLKQHNKQKEQFVSTLINSSNKYTNSKNGNGNENVIGGEKCTNFNFSTRSKYTQPTAFYGNKINESPHKSNGIVYADLDIYKENGSKTNPDMKNPFSSTKTKPKTEYAILNFRDVGREIDV